LATVTTASSLGQLGLGALAVVAAVIATSQARPAATGWLLTSVAVGGLVGSLWWTWRPAAVDRAPRVVMLALAGIGAPLAAAALSSSLVVTAALFTVSGIFLGPFTGALFTTRENRAPADAQAQVFTISAGLKTTAAAAGAALGGALAHLPVPAQLLLVAASPLLAAALGGLALARNRPANRTNPDRRPSLQESSCQSG
jgi:predicted MFS family arabinose efflux permease